MPKTRRWMTKLLEESTKVETVMPWTRGQKGDWHKDMPLAAPKLKTA